MKRLTGVINITSLMITLFIGIGGCGKASEQHVADAKEKIEQANQDMKEAVIDANENIKKKAREDWQKFRVESEKEIAVMEIQTTELKQKISTAGKMEKIKLKASLDAADKILKEQKEKLKQQNTEFEKDIKEFDESVVTKNESFKREFKHDMDELGGAFKALFKDNVN